MNLMILITKTEKLKTKRPAYLRLNVYRNSFAALGYATNTLPVLGQNLKLKAQNLATKLFEAAPAFTRSQRLGSRHRRLRTKVITTWAKVRRRDFSSGVTWLIAHTASSRVHQDVVCKQMSSVCKTFQYKSADVRLIFITSLFKLATHFLLHRLVLSTTEAMDPCNCKSECLFRGFALFYVSCFAFLSLWIVVSNDSFKNLHFKIWFV